VRDKIYIPYKLVDAAVGSTWERAFAYWLRMKSLHRNNTHYNFTLTSLSKKIGCSKDTLAKILPALISNGLVRMHSKNITFTGFKKICSQYKGRIIPVEINYDRKISKQLSIIRGEAYRTNLSQQERNIKKAGNTKRQRNVATLPGENLYGTGTGRYAGLSGKGLGRLIGKSPSTGNRTKISLKVMGKVEVTPMYSIMARNVPYFTFQMMKARGELAEHVRFKKGVVFVRKRDKIEFIDKPYTTYSNIDNNTIRKEQYTAALLTDVSCSQKIENGKKAA